MTASPGACATGAAAPPRLAYVDALKGIAILGVVAVHVSQWLRPASPGVYALAFNGSSGVQMFFLLTVLTACGSLRARQSVERHAGRDFFLRRFFHLVPLFYVAVAAYLWLDGTGPRYWAPAGIHAWQVVLTALLAHGWAPEAINAVFPGVWFVSVVMTFYICVPALAARVSTWRRALALLVGSLALNAILSRVVVRVWTDPAAAGSAALVGGFVRLWFVSQAPVFALGLLLVCVLPHGPRGDAPARSGAVLIAAGAFLSVACLHTTTCLDLVPQHVLFSVAFCLVIAGCGAWPRCPLVNPVLSALGRRSYALFLAHPAIIGYARAHLRPPATVSTVQYLAAVGGVLAASLVVAEVAQRCVEAPGQRLGVRFIGWLNASRTAVSPAQS